MSPILSDGRIFDTAGHGRQEAAMATDVDEPETDEFINCKVRYTLPIGDRIVIVENVPARVSRRTGEQFFSPETTERLWQIVHGDEPPARILETRVYLYQ
jgi:hypothetical protein